MTNFLEAALLNHAFRNVPYSSPAAVFVGLFTAGPGEAGGGIEVSGSGYARQNPGFAAPIGGQISNALDVNFPTATGAWGTVTHVAIFDAVSGGNMLCYGVLAAPKVVDNGDTFKFIAGNLSVALD